MIKISSMVWTYSTLSQQVQRLSIIKAQYCDSAVVTVTTMSIAHMVCMGC